jgi:rubrerythrin
MNVTPGISEILEIAKDIESNGARFYRQAAENASNNQIKQALLELAAMEDGHLDIFEQMKKEFARQKKGHNLLVHNNEAAAYLQNITDGSASAHIKNPIEGLTGNETMKEILELAIETEKNSLLFYIGLKELVPNTANKDQIEAIIKEELSHVVALNLNLTLLG